MAQRPRRREAQLAFEALSIEGGLLSPSFLARIAQLKAPAQSEADYRVPKGLHLRDEIGRYWRVAQAHHGEFLAGQRASADPQKLVERFVSGLLQESFGFGTLKATAPVELGGRVYPIGHAALGGRAPIILSPAGKGVDTLDPMFGDAGRRRSAFGLGQEYLNAAEGALWGVVSDGVTLRVLRDNVSLTRPAWIEADLARIFAEERYSDFAALWLLLHESRFGKPEQPVTECALEAWRSAGLEEGISARARLRDGVEEALLSLGQGFLSHPENASLRAALHGGSLTRMAYFQELLRLVYRLLFLLTAEERGLLHPEGASEKARALYANGYGMRRLRERSVKRSAHDRFSDLWESVRIVFRGLSQGEPLLGLPALAGLFAPSQCPTLDGARLANHALLGAMFRLSWLREESGLSRVNWRDMGPEELGSVYESLLELVPQIAEDGRVFAFATGGETKGNARKLSGSYYTPTSLVEVLLDSALEPVVQQTIAAHPADAAEALLNLSVVDPACGSGHFLLAAANRLAGHVARLRANGTPSPQEHRHALRQVVGRCLYGVDLNPMAVELCKVSLWMEAVEPGRPLSFLDSHIQHGNALLGTTPELMEKGIPDAAWDAIEGDDKKIASALKKQNKKGAGGQRGLDLFARPAESEVGAVARAVGELESAPDEDAGALAQKEEKWRGILGSEAYRHQKIVADAWCAAFVWPKQAGALQDAAPTNEVWRQLKDGQGKPAPLLVKTTEDLAERYRFFHWHLAFPKVFERGGFDVVLGNPPWDALLFQEEEFFAQRRPDVATASTAAARKKMISALSEEDPRLFQEYKEASRLTSGAAAFVRCGITYSLSGVGRVNLFGLFAELARRIVSHSGYVGQILPSGIVTDDSTKLFFQAIVDAGQLVSFKDFENREGLFPAIDSRMKFGILTLAGSGKSERTIHFTFFATRAEHLQDSQRQFTLTQAEIAQLNPITRTCPIFRTKRDAEITKAVLCKMPVLERAGWRVELRRLLNSADDSPNFLNHSGAGRQPLYEGKYFHQYDHRWVTSSSSNDRELTECERSDPNFFIRPRYWYPEEDVRRRFTSTWKRSWALAWRDITNATNERTFIASVVPSLAIPHTAKVIFFAEDQIATCPCLIALLGSIPFDFIARQKMGGTHMSSFIVEQLPVLPPSTYEAVAPWETGTLLRDWILPRVLELTYTAWDLEPFGKDVGYSGPPFRWDPARRFLLRAELDAAFFHLYAISRDDADYILETFPIVRRNDEKAHGEYRTKRAILEVYDALTEATRTGAPYRTRLDPPPADPRAAHPPR